MTENERDEMVAYRIQRAKETLQEVNIHIANRLWHTAINRMYYACFYAVSALLLHNRIRSESHAGARRMLSLHFIKTGIIPKELGKFYSNIFNLRHSGDYDDFIDFDEEDVQINLKPAGKLLNHIEELIHKREN
ncbi:MAG: HEPN domain-containing protein [Bacteroidota bacterium]